MRKSAVSMAIAAVLVAGTPGPLGAQLIDHDIKPDSPVWWSLSDEITPESLRSEFRDPEGSARRLLQAAEAGVESQPANRELDEIKFYLNPQLTPELVPMWWAFDNFCRIWLLEDGELESRTSLRSYGASEEGSQAVVAACRRQEGEFRKRMATLGPRQSRFIEIQWMIWEKLGDTEEARDKVSEWVRQGDVTSISRASGVPAMEIADLLDASRVNAAADAAVVVLPELKARVTERDWEALRSFLLEQAGKRLGAFRDF